MEPCPLGYYCPSPNPATPSGNANVPQVGTRFEFEYPCRDGDFSDEQGRSECKDCTPGRICNDAATNDNERCPPTRYCPLNSGYGNFCELGTYNSDADGLEAAGDCDPCPPGSFCRDGRKNACQAGFQCTLNALVPVPIDGSTGDECPQGNYCEIGVAEPTSCPEGRFRKDTGGRQFEDCTECPPGFYCIPGETEAHECETGGYCPQGVQQPTPCPIRTYNPTKGESTPDGCKACPAGYLCLESGVGDLNLAKYRCLQHHYCVSGAEEAIPCPLGTFNDGYHAGSLEECTPCPGGNYCPNSVGIGQECRNGTYCSPGSIKEAPCPPGYYCPVNTTDPIRCPKGFYCPQYDMSDLTKYINATEPPIACPRGMRCVGGLDEPEYCPKGTRYNLEGEFCEFCPPGTYNDGSEQSLDCLPCTEGYLCLGGTTTAKPTIPGLHMGQECPKGHYCPEGIEAAIACGIGQHNSSTKGVTEADCQLCKEDTFQDESGQPACKQCGANGSSEVGSSTCTCAGRFRHFQKSDRSCRCIASYEAISQGIADDNDDGRIDCSPIIYDICTDERDALGDCVSSGDCDDKCGGSDGTIDSDSGLCIWEGTTSESELWDSTWLTDQPTVKLRSDGVITIWNKQTERYTNITLSSIFDYFGFITCDSNDCDVVNMDMVDGLGFEGRYGVGRFLSTYYNWPQREDETEEQDQEQDSGDADQDSQGDSDQDSSDSDSQTDSDSTDSSTDSDSTDSDSNQNDSDSSPTQIRRLQENDSPGVSSPVLCLTPGQAVLFSVTDTSYPIYVKDSLLNSNSNFDYGPFIELGIRLESGSPLTVFAYTFSEEGVYHFKDKADGDNEMIVGVQTSGCDGTYPIMTRTSSSLRQAGAESRTEFLLGRDFLALGLILLFVLVILVGTSIWLVLYYFKEWAPQFLRNKKKCLSCLDKCFSLCKGKTIEPKQDEFDLLDTAEEINPKTFSDILDRLQRQYESLRRNFESTGDTTSDVRNELIDAILKLENLLSERVKGVSPDDLIRILAGVDEESVASLSSEHSDSEFKEEENEEDKEAEILQRKLSKHFNTASETVLTQTSVKDAEESQRLRLMIVGDPTLAENDKEGLINDFNANIERINNLLDGDKSRSKDSLNRRLQDRAARRKVRNPLDPPLDKPLTEIAEIETEQIKNEYQEKQDIIRQDYEQEKGIISADPEGYLAKQIEDLRQRTAFELAGADNEDEARRIREASEDHEKFLRDQLSADSQTREQELMRRLAEKRKERLAQAKDEYVADRAVLTSQTPSKLEGSGSFNIMKHIIMKTVVGEDADEDQVVKNLKLTQELELDGIANEQQAELEKLREQQETEDLKEIAQISRDKEETEQELLTNRELQARALREKLQLTNDEEERNRIEEQLRNLDTAIYTAQLKNEANLQNRLRDRRRARKAKESDLEKGHKQQLEALADKQSEDLIAKRNEVENAKIENVLSESSLSPEELADTIRALLEQKHEKEIGNLTALKHAKIQTRQMTALQSALNDKAGHITDIREKHKTEAAVLENERLLMSPDEYSRALAQISQRETDEINLADFKFLQNLNSEQSNIMKEVEDEFRQRFTDMAQRHMDETYAIMMRIGQSDKDVSDQFIDQAKQDLESRISEIDVDHKKNMNQIEDREAQLYQQEQDKLAELESLKAEMEELDRKRNDMSEVENKRAELEKKQEEMIQKMKERGIGREAMEEMIEQHKKDMNEWERVMQEERNRQFDILQKKIQLKINRHHAKGVERIKQENLELLKKQDEKIKAKREILFPSNTEPQIYFPQRDIETRLRIPDFQPEIQATPDYKVATDEYNKLLALLERVKNVESIVETVDAKRFEDLVQKLNAVREAMSTVS